MYSHATAGDADSYKGKTAETFLNGLKFRVESTAHRRCRKTTRRTMFGQTVGRVKACEIGKEQLHNKICRELPLERTIAFPVKCSLRSLSQFPVDLDMHVGISNNQTSGPMAAIRGIRANS